jgi:hypothetical protein
MPNMRLATRAQGDTFTPFPRPRRTALSAQSEEQQIPGDVTEGEGEGRRVSP